MEDKFLELGVGGIFCLMILKEVLGFLKKNGTGAVDLARQEELKGLLSAINKNLEAQAILLTKCAEKLIRLESRSD